MEHLQGTVDAPIGRATFDRKLYMVTEKNSKHAVTHFKVLEQFEAYTQVELKLETGRTHQIRVHMKFIGHPLVGDPVYGRSKGVKMDGQALHAAVLGFTHPTTGAYLEFERPMPDDMQHVLTILKSL
jgi:23S rRNA pseudouridine1911/1915/1917 synthase